MVTHYVYKTLLEGNDKYYIGRHSTTKKDILNDGYFGSGVWIRKIKDKNKLSKIILGIYSSIEDLYIAEELWIEKHYSDVNCMNMIYSSSGFKPGHIMSNEIKKKLSDAKKGKSLTKEHKDNISKSVKGKNIGIQNGCAKLTEKDIEEIKILYKKNVSQKQIATTFNVNRKTIYRIINGKSWQHQ